MYYPYLEYTIHVNLEYTIHGYFVVRTVERLHPKRFVAQTFTYAL